MKDKTELEKAAYQIGDIGVQVDFIAKALLSEQMDWGDAQSIFSLLLSIGEKINTICGNLHDMAELQRKDERQQEAPALA